MRKTLYNAEVSERILRPKGSEVHENEPGLLRLSQAESNVLVDIARRYEEEFWVKLRAEGGKTYIGETRGMLRLLGDILKNFDGIDQTYREPLRPIHQKIVASLPELAAASSEQVEWRFVAVPRTENPSVHLQPYVNLHGKNPRDPGQGTFIADHTVEEYVRDVNPVTSYALFAYRGALLRNATREEAGESGAFNNRLVPKSGELRDTYLGGIVVEPDDAIPAFSLIRERVATDLPQWLEESTKRLRDEVSALCERGCIYEVAESAVREYIQGYVLSVLHELRAAHEDVMKGTVHWSRTGPMTTFDFLAVFPEAADMAERTTFKPSTFSIRGNILTDAGLRDVTHAISLPVMLKSEVSRKLQKLVEELVGDMKE